MTMVTETAGERIRRLRRAAGLSQGELALAAHINQGHLCNIENGKRRATETVGTSLASLLGVSVHYLKTGQPDPPDERVRTRLVLNMAKAWRDAARALAYQIVMNEGGLADVEMEHLADVLLDQARDSQGKDAKLHA